MPIPADVMQDQCVIPWIANDPQVHLEVNSALATRADDFAPQSMDVIKRMMDSHCGPRNIPIVDAMSKLECSKAGLDQQEFELLMSQMAFDVDAWRVHHQTCSDYSGSLHKQRSLWNLKRHEQRGKAADMFLQQNCYMFVYDKDPMPSLLGYMTWKKEIAATIQIPDERGYTFA